MSLRQLRRSVGLTQAGLAAHAGIDQSTISRIEAGTISDSQHATLAVLARCLTKRLRYNFPEMPTREIRPEDLAQRRRRTTTRRARKDQ